MLNPWALAAQSRPKDPWLFTGGREPAAGLGRVRRPLAWWDSSLWRRSTYQAGLGHLGALKRLCVHWVASVNPGFSSRGDQDDCVSLAVKEKEARGTSIDALNLGDKVSHLTCCGLDHFRVSFPPYVKSTAGPETSPETAPCGPAGWLYQKAVCSEKLESSRSVMAWMELQRGVKCPGGPASCSILTPQAAFAMQQDVFSATACNVFCAGGWRERMRRAIAGMKNPLLNSSGLQVFSKDKPSHGLSFIAGCLLSKCLKPLLKTSGSQQPALQNTAHWGFRSAGAKSYIMGFSCLRWWADVVQWQRGPCTTTEPSHSLTCETQAHDERQIARRSPAMAHVSSIGFAQWLWSLLQDSLVGNESVSSPASLQAQSRMRCNPLTSLSPHHCPQCNHA